MLHTAPYARLCRRLGWFVHHRPERRDPTRHNVGEFQRTMARITDAGYAVDARLRLATTRETKVVTEVGMFLTGLAVEQPRPGDGLLPPPCQSA